MMRVSLGHRFFAIEANLPSLTSVSGSQPAQLLTGQVAAGTDLDFVRRGPLRPLGPGLGHPPARLPLLTAPPAPGSGSDGLIGPDRTPPSR